MQVCCMVEFVILNVDFVQIKYITKIILFINSLNIFNFA